MRELRIKKDQRCLSCKCFGLHHWKYELKAKDPQELRWDKFIDLKGYCHDWDNIQQELKKLIEKAINDGCSIDNLYMFRSCYRKNCDLVEIAKVEGDYDYYTMTFRYFSGTL